MKALSLFISLAFCLWGLTPADAVTLPLADAGSSMHRKGKKKSHRRPGWRKVHIPRDRHGNDSDLGRHPLPRYTDFSKLNSRLDQLEKNYRNRELRAYKPLDDVSRRLKIGRYSSYENPTGIAFEAGENITVQLEGSPRTRVEFIVRDFRHPGAESRFPLAEGQNRLRVKHYGHGYIDYRDAEPDTAPPIKVQIQGGTINGVFTHHDDARVWKHLLRNAKSEMFDIMGERTQWLLATDALRKRCPEKGPELVALYNEQMRLEQQLLGWEWEGIHPGNHIMGRTNWNTATYMHADGLGGSYVISATPGLVDVDEVRRSGAWGTSHEFGHVNQTRPGMLWTGTTETTVNIFSQLVNYTFNPGETRLEHENCRTLEGPWVRGGRFDCFVNSAIVNRELWQFQRGPDDGDRPPGATCGDCFVILCPMWQMYLYNTVAKGNKLFYPRIFKSVRDTDESSRTMGQLRMKYLDRCCDAAGLDFSDYFLETGMLAVMNRYVNDYSSRWMTIDEEMCRAALQHARQYTKPDSPVIFYITANNVGIYRDRSNIQPSPDFKPQITEKPLRRFTVPGSKWANAVAFEVYNGHKLIRICLRGLNQKDNSSTDVILPPGATTVMAVQWDGRRYIIYDTQGRSVDDKPDLCSGPGQPRELTTKSKRQRRRK